MRANDDLCIPPEGRQDETGSFRRVENLYCLQSYELRGVMCGMRARYACVPTLRRNLMTSLTGLKTGSLDNMKYTSHQHLFIV